MSVLPWLLNNPNITTLAPIANVGVKAGLLECVINLEYDFGKVYASYFYSPIKLRFNSEEYFIGSLYVDALITK
ncbi:MAG: hypothetical protein B6U85_08905 [Desulfurococcales archaeon ex4484_42]|nr:MAG: hypothetical protein B6U85_08905 [Desulfurococcales archaeon ex4484_42]